MQIRNQVLNLGHRQGISEGWHHHPAVMNLQRDLRFVHALADELKVWTFLASDTRGTVTMGAATLFKQLCAALFWIRPCGHGG
jgi:hypothetical protein